MDVPQPELVSTAVDSILVGWMAMMGASKLCIIASLLFIPFTPTNPGEFPLSIGKLLSQRMTSNYRPVTVPPKKTVVFLSTLPEVAMFHVLRSQSCPTHLVQQLRFFWAYQKDVANAGVVDFDSSFAKSHSSQCVDPKKPSKSKINSPMRLLKYQH